MVLKDENWEEFMELFLSIGLEEKTARNTINNRRLTTNLTLVIDEAGVTDGCDRTSGNLLYSVATRYPANALVHRCTLLKYIVSSKIKTPAQLDAALLFLANTGAEEFEVNEFEEACGVGIEVSPEDFERVVKEVIEENKTTILEQRYRTNGVLFGHVRKILPWADPKIVKKGIDQKMYELLGERTAADNKGKRT